MKHDFTGTVARWTNRYVIPDFSRRCGHRICGIGTWVLFKHLFGRVVGLGWSIWGLNMFKLNSRIKLMEWILAASTSNMLPFSRSTNQDQTCHSGNPDRPSPSPGSISVVTHARPITPDQGCTPKKTCPPSSLPRLFDNMLGFVF